MTQTDLNATPPSDALGPDRFVNRDTSWLEFNRRVLAQAFDREQPLLERVKFLAIFSNNLDEFYMKRVGYMLRDLQAGNRRAGPDGMTRAEALAATRELVTDLQSQQSDCYQNDVLPALHDAGIRIHTYAGLTEEHQASLNAWFMRNALPVLTPLAVDPGHPFPFVSNLSENLGVLVTRPGTAERHFARVKIPDVLPRFVPLPDADSRPDELGMPSFDFVPLDELITANLGAMFPGMTIAAVAPFRVTRSAAIEREDSDDEVEDLLEYVEEELHLRRFADAVRLEMGPNPDPTISELVREELKLSEREVYRREGPMEYTDLFQIASLPRPDLKEEPWTPVAPRALADEERSIFSVMRERDVLLHHPYESFEHSVERFVDEASRDPNVLAIKQTIYRTSRDSPFVASLIRAAEAGKAVACLVELRARFDEARNVTFARQLEQAGVHVAYGVVGLKTHCKCSLVVRREDEGLRTYAHIGTGNYHPATAQLYTDLGLLTADPTLTGDVVRIFNELTGHAHKPAYDRLVVAPHAMRSRFEELIDREIQHASAGKPSRIVAKINSLEDRKITQRLYKASQAGVPVTLVVRGFCCLRPGVMGLSENIRVISIVGRFLEHSRIFHFANASADPAQGGWYIGSADWMYRNLNNRVEAMTPILDGDARTRLAGLLDAQLRDHRYAWDMNPDGSYTARTPPTDAASDAPERIGLFETLMREASTS
ncbi:MAG: polyphosphate kinase 1 [Planctomycetota bacterium]